MLRLTHFTRFRHCAAWLLAVGLFAMAMQAFGSIGLMRENFAGGGFYAEICTGKGLNMPDSAPLFGGTSHPASDQHDCCKLCAASAPLLIVEAMLGVLPAPSLAWLFPAAISLRPAAIARVPHLPRGPPLV